MTMITKTHIIPTVSNKVNGALMTLQVVLPSTIAQHVVVSFTVVHVYTVQFVVFPLIIKQQVRIPFRIYVQFSFGPDDLLLEEDLDRDLERDLPPL